MRRITTNPWIVCVTAAAFSMYLYIQITVFNVLTPDLVVAYNTTPAALSHISALYFYGTALLMLPAGVLLDSFSTRKIILLTMSLTIAGLIIFTTAQSLFMAGVGRLLMGISGSPFCFLASLRLASHWFTERHLAFVTGVIVAMTVLGGIISQLPFAMLIRAFGWQRAMYFNICLGVLILGLIFLVVHDSPASKAAECLQQRANYRKLGFIAGLKKVLSKLQNWYCGFFVMLLNLPIFVLGAFLGVVYLQAAFNLGRVEASFVCAWLFVGMLIGAPFFGYVSDKLRLRKPPMLAGILLCIIPTLIVLTNSNLSIHSLVILFSLIGFGSGAQSLAYPTVAENNPATLTTSALSLASTILMAGSAIFQPIIAHSKLGVWLLPITMAIAAIFVWMIKETHCRRIAK